MKESIFDQVAALNHNAPPPTLRDVFGNKARAARTNSKNDGRGFQLELESTAAGYQTRGLARFEKVDPPARMMGGGPSRRVIFMKNPFLDFIGVWSKRGGRMLAFEAKSTANHRLAFNNDNGLTSTQWAAMKSWRMAGAACCLLWKHADAVVLFTPEMLQAAQARGDKSLVFESGIAIGRGEGRIIWDFLPVLEAILWPANK